MARKKSAAKKAREEAEKKSASVTAPEVTDSVPDTKAPSKKVQIKEPRHDVEDDASSSSSEEEDEYGEMLTENIESLIQNIIKTIKSDPKKLLDPNVKFFNEDDASVTSGQPKEKPMYLKDYHRMNLLSGSFKDDDDAEGQNEFDTVDGQKPYAVAEREERNQLLDDIKNAFKNDEEDDGDESDDGFLKKKENTTSRIEEVGLAMPDPSKNPQDFLSAFLDNQAWIPKKNDKVINLDQIDNEDEQDFDDAVEDFEKAYNFRYEDPNSAEIVSYARNQATLRRGKTNSRKRARDKKNALKQQEDHEKEQAVQKKKTAKLNKVIDRLSKIKEAVGEDVNDETIERVFGDSLLNDDFDDADWDSKMADIFNDQYYNSEITKPEWDEDDDIMAEYHESKKNEDQKGEGEEDDGKLVEDIVEDAQVDDDEPPKKRSKKDKLKEKKQSKKEKQSIREKAEKIVEANKMKIVDEVEEERGRSAEQDPNRFKYREVSPETFGLSTREILLADDSELNQFISIKKFAPYRPKELVLKDKRKLKKKQLQQWRREVFKSKDGPERQAEEGENDIWIPIEEEKPLKKLKVSKRR